jgi:hypothetical protein
MARILPNTPVGVLSPETLKVYRLLKQLPDELFTVWQRLSVWPEAGPDFWVLRQDGRALLIKVSTATAKQAREAGQQTMFAAPDADSTRPIGMVEQEALLQFQDMVAPAQPATLPGIVLCPNLAPSELQLVQPAELPPGIIWAGKEVLLHFSTWLEQHLGAHLPEATINQVRTQFTPEVIIPVDFTVRTPIARNTSAGLTEYLLDYDQEWALKLDLDLSQEAESSAHAFSLRLINGVAGSGKSLIVIYRAHLLRRLYPHKRILVLTHNRPLINDLSDRYERLRPAGRPVEWRTFLGWCRANWPPSEPWLKPIGARQRDQLIDQMRQTYLADTSISNAMLRDEIDWMKDRLPLNRAEYLLVDRSGRGFGLTEALRQRVFDTMVAYQRDLHAKGMVDWGDIPRRMWKFLQDGNLQLPTYDIIHVDEAQFFAPIWFEIVKHILEPSNGHLFLVADPTQGFLKRRQSWLASGLEVRGRAQRLAKSYRTTREILTFATVLYQLRVPHDDDEIVAPHLQQMPHGPLPQLIRLTSGQDELTRVVNEIHALVQADIPLKHILVLHTDWLGAERMLTRLRDVFGDTAAGDAKVQRSGNHIRVCTLNAATGLESPIVFLLGMHALLEEEQSLRLSAEERQELIRDNARRLYMGMTRAGQRLVITYVGELPEVLLRVLALTQQQTGVTTPGMSAG